MGFFNKDAVENEALSLAEKAAGKVFDSFVAKQGAAAPSSSVSSGLVGVIVEAVTNHITTAGVAPDIGLLKTSIGQLIEGTVGVLQATGRITPVQAQKDEVVAQAVAQATQAVQVPLTTRLAPPTPQSIG
jgi:hypothetical protein